MINVEIVEFSRGSIASKFFGVGIDTGRIQQLCEFLHMFSGHLFFDAICTEFAHPTAHVNVGLVDLIAKKVASIPADNNTALLSHECAHVTDVAGNDDIDTFH